MKKFEQPIESKEKPTSKIVLEFFRHGKKEKQKEGMPEKEIRLSPEGSREIIKKGKKIHPQAEVAVGIGSPRKRTQETAAKIIYAEKVTPKMSLEEIEEVIKSELKYGKKITSDPRLDFNERGPVGKRLTKAYNEGRTIQYMVYESDEDAIKLKDKESSTYSRAAGNIAELIKKYIDISSRFDNLVKTKPEKYKKYNNQMERYLGSHQCIVESFLAKVLEKTRGVKHKDKLIRSLGAGFKEGEGYRIEIINTSQGPKLEINYQAGDKKESLEIPKEIIEKIIKEKDDLDKKIKES